MNRIVAASIATTAMAGLIVQFSVTHSLNGSALKTLWILAAYFTITTNLLVAVVFSAVVISPTGPPSSSVVSGTMLCILLVGVIYYFLLHGLLELSGGSRVANVLLHLATPVLVPLFWICFTPKGKLDWRDLYRWTAYPIAYLLYALCRGRTTGKYAYPFLDVGQLGWQRVGLYIVVVASAFVVSSCALVWLDHRLGERREGK